MKKERKKKYKCINIYALVIKRTNVTYTLIFHFTCFDSHIIIIFSLNILKECERTKFTSFSVSHPTTQIYTKDKQHSMKKIGVIKHLKILTNMYFIVIALLYNNYLHREDQYIYTTPCQS